MASWTGDLMVRPVLAGETARFDHLLQEHHWLGARLFGSVVRHVAVLGGTWVALLGYGSAVLRCTARDTVIGWSDADRVDRLPLLAGQQRFCVLPQGRQPNLASAVLARSLARLPGAGTPARATPRPGSPVPDRPRGTPAARAGTGMPSTGR